PELAFVARLDGLDVRSELGRHRPLAEHARDASLELAAALRFRRAEVVEPGARMGVEHAQRVRLALKRPNQQSEHGMLQHVGVVAGVILVLIAQQAPRVRPVEKVVHAMIRENRPCTRARRDAKSYWRSPASSSMLSPAASISSPTPSTVLQPATP